MSGRTQADEHCPTKIHGVKKNHFSQGLRVLAIDDNVVCLKVLASNLQKCGYKVSTTTNALEAIEMLRKNKDAYDVVITDAVRSDMDGFQIVEIIEHETSIPVIMTSANNDVEIIEKAVRHGALDYLVKPVRVEILKNIWQHVIRKSMDRWKRVRQIENVGANAANKNNIAVGMKDDPECDGAQSICSTGDNDNSQADSRKRPRVDWAGHLNDKFLDVVRRLEAQDIKVVPKVILNMMNKPNLTRQQVASHLQKHRLADQERKEPMEVREISRQLSHINGYIPRLIGPNIAPFSSMYAQSQPQPHQNFRPIQCSYPNMIPERIQNQRNSSHVSGQMEIQPEALNLPRFGSVDSLPSYCNQQNNVSIQAAHPCASKSNLVANGYQVVGDIVSQRTSVVQPNSNVGPVSTYLPGSYEDRKPFVIADPRAGCMGGQLQAPKEESAVKRVGYMPHVSDTHVGQIQAPKEESAIKSVGYAPHVSDTHVGQIQAPKEESAFKSVEYMAPVSDTANICFEYEEIGALVNHCPAPTL